MNHKILRAKTLPPTRDLLEVKGVGWVALKPFGRKSVRDNIESMAGAHSHPVTYESITFRPATPAEAIAITAYMVSDEKVFQLTSNILHAGWLQAGRIVKTREGVWVNVSGHFKEDTLKRQLTKDKFFKGIYLISKGRAFAPYGTFNEGLQDVREFTEGPRSGLARALEYTKTKARNFGIIADSRNYPKGVYLGGFESVETPREECLVIYSTNPKSEFPGVGRLDVISDGKSEWPGYAFGVLNRQKAKNRVKEKS